MRKIDFELNFLLFVIKKEIIMKIHTTLIIIADFQKILEKKDIIMRFQIKTYLFAKAKRNHII